VGGSERSRAEHRGSMRSAAELLSGRGFRGWQVGGWKECSVRGSSSPGTDHAAHRSPRHHQHPVHHQILLLFPLSESVERTCIWACGQMIDNCSVGSLRARWFSRSGRKTEIVESKMIGTLPGLLTATEQASVCWRHVAMHPGDLEVARVLIGV
jgi:hypothetical protein